QRASTRTAALRGPLAATTAYRAPCAPARCPVARRANGAQPVVYDAVRSAKKRPEKAPFHARVRVDAATAPAPISAPIGVSIGPRPISMRYEFCARTDRGRVRANNEDAVSVDEQRNVAVLADGMGGYNAGEVASG